jgi:hypothetical protein
VFNCDDLLLNYVAANWSSTLATASQTGDGSSAAAASGAAPPAVQLVRPERRIDVSRLSGVGECARALLPWLLPARRFF